MGLKITLRMWISVVLESGMKNAFFYNLHSCTITQYPLQQERTIQSPIFCRFLLKFVSVDRQMKDLSSSAFLRVSHLNQDQYKINIGQL